MTHAKRNQKIILAIDAATKRALVSQKTARDALIKDGIYTAAGKLKAEFGGQRQNLKKQPVIA